MLIFNIHTAIFYVHKVAILTSILVKDFLISRALLQVRRVFIVDQVLEIVLTSALTHLCMQLFVVRHVAFFHNHALTLLIFDALTRGTVRILTEQVLVGLVTHGTPTPRFFRLTNHILLLLLQNLLFLEHDEFGTLLVR